MLDIILMEIENEEDRDFVAEIFQKVRKKVVYKSILYNKKQARQ